MSMIHSDSQRQSHSQNQSESQSSRAWTAWVVLYRKELLEMWRSYKLLWVPLVFVLFGASQPVATYYMPDLLQASGGLPEGAVIQIPMPTGAEMMANTLSQFSFIGVLVLVLAFMGVVSGERASGVVHMIMMKPVPHRAYMLAKWAGMATLTLIALLGGVAAAWYYTELLIGHVAFPRIAASTGLYGLWLLFIATLTLLFSSLFRSGGVTAFLAMGITLVLSLLTGTLGNWMRWSPAALTEHSNTVLLRGGLADSFGLCLAVALLLIVLLLEGAVRTFRVKGASL